ARKSAGAGTPIFTVPVGSSRRVKDIAIVDVFSTELLSVGDIGRVSVTIESHGFDPPPPPAAAKPVKVELKEGDKVLDTKQLVLRGAEQQHLDLTFKAEKAGVRYFTVEVEPQPEEAEYLRDNNREVVSVRVSEEKL